MIAKTGWIDNPFGLARWIEANTNSILVKMLEEKAKDYSAHTRDDIAQEAQDCWDELQALEAGVFRMALDWSWFAPIRNVPCLWSMADEKPTLYDHFQIVSVTTKRRERPRIKPYKDSPNVTICDVEMEAFFKALPPAQRQIFTLQTLDGYREWAQTLVMIGLRYHSDPSTRILLRT